MATIGTATSAQIKNTPRRIYIAALPFNNDFFTYTVTKSVQGQSVVTTGSLDPVTTDSSKTPAGRTLRETGKKLYPDAHPGVHTYMVGVYDDQTGLNGFINPNSPAFGVLNTDKPAYLPDGTDPGSYSALGTNQGSAIVSRGPIVSNDAYVAGNARAISGDYNAGNANIFPDPLQANFYTADITSMGSSKTCYVYFAPAVENPAPPAGHRMTLIARTGANATTLLFNNVSANTRLTTNGSSVALSANTYYTFNFVSDGTTYWEVSRLNTAYYNQAP